MKNAARVVACWPRIGAIVMMCVACIGLMSCGSQMVGTTSGPMTSPGTSPTGQQTVISTHTTNTQGVQVGDDQNGQTVTLRPGEILTVVLSSTFWTFQGSSNAQVIAPVGPAVETPAAFDPTVCPYGGCGTVKATFRAVAPGGAHVTATRVSCGEALKCTGSNALYQLTIVVTAG